MDNLGNSICQTCILGLMDQTQQKITSWLGSGSINIFGMPYAGKDTQCRALAVLVGGVVISSGELLRNHPDQVTVQRIMADGDIVPSRMFEEIALPYLSKPEFSGKPLILSEVGRVKGEDEITMQATEQSGHPTKAVIYITLDESEVWKRFDTAMATGDRGTRADDNRAVLQTRLDKYRELVIPVVELYRDRGLLLEVDGSLTREAVTEQIINSLAEQAGA